nr:hypothetical protein [Tanacetum cinerariifolium]
MDEEEDDEVTKELYKDRNVNLVHHEITSTATVHPPPSFFNPLQQKATPTPTPTTLETTTSLPLLLDFAF